MITLGKILAHHFPTPKSYEAKAGEITMAVAIFGKPLLGLLLYSNVISWNISPYGYNSKYNIIMAYIIIQFIFSCLMVVSCYISYTLSPFFACAYIYICIYIYISPLGNCGLPSGNLT